MGGELWFIDPIRHLKHQNQNMHNIEYILGFNISYETLDTRLGANCIRCIILFLGLNYYFAIIQDIIKIMLQM